MARSAGVVVPAVQDFGLTLVETQASGRPPIAFGAGGALEIIDDGRTGFLFGEQTPVALGAAMERALTAVVDPASLVASARRFDVATFRSRFLAAIAPSLEAATAAVPAGGAGTGEPALPAPVGIAFHRRAPGRAR